MVPETQNQLNKAAFIGLFFLTALPLVSSPVALVAGFSFSFVFGNPLPQLTARVSKTLLKLSVVGLGFGVNFVEVIEVGKNSILLTLVSISATIGLGLLLGRALRLPKNTVTLLSFGTAICGGSAIAAMAPVIRADDDEIAVSLATVFALNAVALVIFPPLGALFHLDQNQFGLWAALAIHDTSSVVGASAAYGALALSIGTTAKLTRALWIAPFALVAGFLCQSKERTGIPLFILGFIAAAFINNWLPEFQPLWNVVYAISKQSLVMTLFLIGAGLTRQVLRQVGLKPLLLGVILWIIVSIATLILIVGGQIS
ncbi:MAG: putative sulfate exporter family transporter [Desulfuromonadales bacterium]|nr:putative sulfate exporter family transporter [Desulfuromonadales bacterium]